MAWAEAESGASRRRGRGGRRRRGGGDERRRGLTSRAEAEKARRWILEANMMMHGRFAGRRCEGNGQLMGAKGGRLPGRGEGDGEEKRWDGSGQGGGVKAGAHGGPAAYRVCSGNLGPIMCQGRRQRRRRAGRARLALAGGSGSGSGSGGSDEQAASRPVLRRAPSLVPVVGRRARLPRPARPGAGPGRGRWRQLAPWTVGLGAHQVGKEQRRPLPESGCRRNGWCAKTRGR